MPNFWGAWSHFNFCLLEFVIKTERHFDVSKLSNIAGTNRHWFATLIFMFLLRARARSQLKDWKANNALTPLYRVWVDRGTVQAVLVQEFNLTTQSKDFMCNTRDYNKMPSVQYAGISVLRAIALNIIRNSALFVLNQWPFLQKVHWRNRCELNFLKLN